MSGSADAAYARMGSSSMSSSMGKSVTERISLSLSILFGTEQQVAKSAIERYERYRVT